MNIENDQKKGEPCWYCGFHSDETGPCACHNMEMTWYEQECDFENYWQNQTDFYENLEN